MQLTIGKTIKARRIEHGLTQEELAAHLGISPQSISKWERSDGYPDITMLPALSRYFGITVDELIGADSAANATKYEEINRSWAYNNHAGAHAENIELMNSALREFPNDSLLLVQLSTSLEKADGSAEERAKYLRKSIAVQEQILRYAEDCEVRGATQFNICFSYRKDGQHAKALEQAKKLPNLYKSRENALIYFLSGEEKRKVAKEALERLAWSITHHLSALADTEQDTRHLDKAARILDILLETEENDRIRSIRMGLDVR